MLGKSTKREVIKMHTISKLFVSLLVALVSIAVSADEVEDSVREAMEYYRAGQYSDAAQSLNYAAQLIQQLKGESLESYLPAALPGWTSQDSSSESMAMGMFGGGITARREYSRGNSSISIQIITDSPLMQSALMMLSNPMMARSSGGKLERIKGERALVKYEQADRQGEIQIVVANKMLVTIEGYDVTIDELRAYAQAINFAKLKQE